MQWMGAGLLGANTDVSQSGLMTRTNLDTLIMRRSDLATNVLLSSQWKTPSNVFSVLLIIGGDVIQKALAQLSGYCLVPVAFSFGWVAYSFSTLMAIVGDGHLMPLPDYPIKVINADNGYTRANRSWILGRLVRDFEFPIADDIGLHITVFEPVKNKKAGKPEKDKYWYSGIVVIIMQLGISTIPYGLYNDWGIVFVTTIGTVLALCTGALPQWRFEKWACRTNTPKTLILTIGNGSRHVLVIRSNGKGLDLEDLAVAESPRMMRRNEHSSLLKTRPRENPSANNNSRMQIWEHGGVPVSFLITQIVCVILAVPWIMFLITVVGLKENTWYLLAIGGLGMVQNVVVAGARRGISTTGIHLEEIDKFGQGKVMDALMDLELKYKKVGKALLTEFFNGSLRNEEVSWWDSVSTFHQQPKGELPEGMKAYDDQRKARRFESWKKRHDFLTNPDNLEKVGIQVAGTSQPEGRLQVTYQFQNQPSHMDMGNDHA